MPVKWPMPGDKILVPADFMEDIRQITTTAVMRADQNPGSIQISKAGLLNEALEAISAIADDTATDKEVTRAIYCLALVYIVDRSEK